MMGAAPLRAHVTRGDGLAAVLAAEPERGHVSAAAVHALDGRSPLPGEVPVAPAGDRDDDAVQVEALLRQAVLEARRPVLVALAPEHAVLHQPREAVGEAVAAEAQARLEPLEAPRPEERVAQHEERPAVADDGERPGDRAVELSDLAPAHGATKFQNGTVSASPARAGRARAAPPRGRRSRASRGTAGPRRP